MLLKQFSKQKTSYNLTDLQQADSGHREIQLVLLYYHNQDKKADTVGDLKHMKLTPRNTKNLANELFIYPAQLFEEKEVELLQRCQNLWSNSSS